ncbi:MAG TPA: DMT family transporter [Candidatus Acidoferrales bacterium]|nr:DMT family transporter [Candidatus Acidoferrales bacterium]
MPSPIRRNERAFLDYALLILLSVVWGLAFVAIRVLDTKLSFVNLALLRWLIASAGYLALLACLGKPRTAFSKADLPRLLLIGFFNVAGYHLSLNFAEVTVSAGLAGLLITLGPVFSALLSVVLLKERIGRRLILAIALAVSGAAILSAGELSGGSSPYGPLGVVLAALSYALFAVLAKPLVGKYGALRVAIWAGVVGTATLLPLWSPSFLAQVSRLSFPGWEALLYLSILSTVMGYSLFYTLVEKGGVSRVMIQLYLAPVFSVIGGMLLLGETANTETVLGGSAMLLAVWIATTKRKPMRDARELNQAAPGTFAR